MILSLDFKALDVLCAQLTRNLLAIAKFIFERYVLTLTYSILAYAYPRAICVILY